MLSVSIITVLSRATVSEVLFSRC